MVILKLKNKNFTSIKTYFIKNIDINKIVVSNIVSSGKKGFKYFIGYKNAKNIKHLWVFHPKMSAYRKDFDETIFMSFFDKRWWIIRKI